MYFFHACVCSLKEYCEYFFSSEAWDSYHGDITLNSRPDAVHGGSLPP